MGIFLSGRSRSFVAAAVFVRHSIPVRSYVRSSVRSLLFLGSCLFLGRVTPERDREKSQGRRRTKEGTMRRGMRRWEGIQSKCELYSKECDEKGIGTEQRVSLGIKGKIFR